MGKMTVTIEITGDAGSGKTVIGALLCDFLFSKGIEVQGYDEEILQRFIEPSDQGVQAVVERSRVVVKTVQSK